MINWLYTSTLDLSLLVGLVLLIRTPVRRLFGAHIAYLLWVIPFLSVLIPVRFERPNLMAVPEMPDGLLQPVVPDGQVYYLPEGVPLLEIWLVGMILCLALQVILQKSVYRAFETGARPVAVENGNIRQLIADHRLDEERIRTSASVFGPCLFGLFKPVIYLPGDFANQYSPDEQFWILKHELTHLRRRDLWTQAIAELFRAIYWFNPIVHLALRSFRDDQEMACDHDTLADCDEADRFAYGHTLLRTATTTLVPSVLTFFTTPKERFNMLRHHRDSKLNTFIGLALCGLLGTFAVTKAPDAIAQSEVRPEFEEVYDANFPRRFIGVIVRVDYSENFTLLHVNTDSDSGVVQWIVEGGSWQEMHDAGLDSNALFPGRQVTVTGYQSKDQSCDPKCKLNGRDLSFVD